MVIEQDFGRIYGGVIILYQNPIQDFCISSYKDTFVYDILTSSQSGASWNLVFSRDLFEWEVDIVAD